MNCQTVLTLLDAHSAGAVAGPLRAGVETHLNECASCRAELSRIQGLVRMLRSVQVPEPPLGLNRRLVQGAIVRSQRRGQWRATGFAVAATLVVGIAIGFSLQTQPLPFAAQDQQVTLTAGIVDTVALDVRAPRAIENVRFVLNIPEGFDLAGHEGKRRIAWSGQLKPGVNRLKLRLKGQLGSAGMLAASVRYDGQVKSFKVMLQASPEAPAGIKGAVRSGVSGTTAAI